MAPSETRSQRIRSPSVSKFYTHGFYGCLYSPVHDWLAVRRKGQDFEHTPMGFVTTGKSLTADHAFFLAENEEDSNLASKMGVAASAAHQAEDEDSDDGDEHEHDHLIHGDNEDDDGDDGESNSGEDVFDEKDSTFFDVGVYVDKSSESSPTKG
jgi:hypothetical protein